MKTTLHVEGMSCEHCVKAVSEALKAVPGVNSANVNLKAKTAEVDHNAETTLDALKAAVEEEGFTAA